MSEYWVSHKRYHCKYCNIYIADDKPSRQQHENGLRHKGNVERFVRGLYKEEEKRAREREEEKKIMASVGKAAEAAYALDVATGRGGSSSGGSTEKASTVAPRLKPKVKPSDPYANYSTPGSLGYVDPGVEEAQQRVHAGTPGAWTVVNKTESKEEEEEKKEDMKVSIGEKRTAEEEDDIRAFKLRKKTATLGLGEDTDRPGQPAEQPIFRKRKVRQRGV